MGTGKVHIGGDLAHVAVEVAAVPVVQHVAGHLHAEGVAAPGAEVEVDLHGDGRHGQGQALRPGGEDGAVHVAAAQTGPGRAGQHVTQQVGALEGFVHGSHARDEGRMVHEDQGRAAAVFLQAGIQPAGHGPGAVAAVGAGLHAVQQDKAQFAHVHAMADARRHGALFGHPAFEDGAHAVAAVMVAGHGVDGHGQVAEGLADHVVGTLVAAVGQVAGDDDGVGHAGQGMQMGRRRAQAGGRVHLAEGELAVAAQVQVR